MKVLIPSVIFVFSSFLGISQVDSVDLKKDVPINAMPPLPVSETPKSSKSTQVLNGYHVLHNKNGQKTKDGTFKDDHFMEGKSYYYNEDGTINHIAVYKNGVYVSESKKE
jgi:hypothetical protein